MSSDDEGAGLIVHSEAKPLNIEAFEASVLEGNCLRLEPLIADHAAVMFDGLQSPEAYRYIPQEPPATLNDLAIRYGKLESRRSPDGGQAWLNWALVDPERNAHGYVQATVDLSSREAWLAYFIFSASQRRGYAKEALSVLLPALRKVYRVGLFRAEIDTRNIASIRLIESLGFEMIRHVPNADEFKGSTSDEYHYARD